MLLTKWNKCWRGVLYYEKCLKFHIASNYRQNSPTSSEKIKQSVNSPNICPLYARLFHAPPMAQPTLASCSATVHQNRHGWLQKVTILGHVMLPIASRLILSYSPSRQQQVFIRTRGVFIKFPLKNMFNVFESSIAALVFASIPLASCTHLLEYVP